MVFGLFGKSTKTESSPAKAAGNKKDNDDTLPPHLFAGVLDPNRHTVSGICDNAEEFKSYASGLLAQLNKYCIDHHRYANEQRDKLIKITRALAPHASAQDFLQFIANAQHDLAWEFFHANTAFTLTEADMTLIRNPPRPSRLYSSKLIPKALLRVRPVA